MNYIFGLAVLIGFAFLVARNPESKDGLVKRIAVATAGAVTAAAAVGFEKLGDLLPFLDGLF